MQKFENHLVGVDQGDVVLFSDFEDDGQMWTGDGTRKISVPVRFSGAYQSPPIVTVSIMMWDMSNLANARVDLQAEDITETGFSIAFSTWADTKVARVRVAWQSIGAVANDDAWDV